MEHLVFAGQILLSTLLGGLIGSQRERIGKAAGSRTYALVSLGATLFTLLSKNAFGGYSDAAIAAQIVTGIGFLGAGTIIHKSGGIEGLTTAAGLWAVAAVGMAVGVGWYIPAAIAAVVIFLVLIMDNSKFLEK